MGDKDQEPEVPQLPIVAVMIVEEQDQRYCAVARQA
jgi:hypothetical protein